MLTKEQIEDYECMYGIAISDEHKRILNTPKGELDEMERQSQFLIEQALAPISCPHCTETTCMYAASTRKDKHGHGVNDDDYACNFCTVPLHYHLGMVAGEQWFTKQKAATT
jgi:Fe-S-cluster-containing dehydrogenase component